MNRGHQAGDIIFLAHVLRQFQHFHEHGRDQLRMRDLVFLDEPTSGLDLASIDLVKNQVLDLSAQLIVVVTHDNFLDSNADEILYLDQNE